ncbi:hypothetical protein ACOSQ2_031943 [Xanthoceras sorbifolium]
MDSTQVSDNEEAANYLFAMQLASGSVLPMVLKSAIELDLLEIIAKAGPGAFMSPKEIASHLPTKNPDAPLMLDRILRLLASYSILTCSLRYSSLPADDGKVERLYGLAPVCKYFTKNEDGVSLSALVLLREDRVFINNWYYLKDAVLEGGAAFEKAQGMGLFEYLGTNPRFNMIFNNGMSSHSKIAMKKVVETYKGFEGLKSIVDVGGGTGAALSIIISKYPSIKGINFDLPHVIKDAPSYPDNEEAANYLFAMQLASGSVLHMVLKSAIELDLLEIIAKAGPGAFMSPKDIASHLPTINPDAPLMLDRILRLLASYSILTCSLRHNSLPGEGDDGKVERLYGLAPVCKYLTKNDDGVSLSALALLRNDNWYYLKDAVLEGGVAFEKAHGMGIFEYLGTNPTFNKIFNNAMSSHSTIAMKKVVETYKGFEGLKSIVDVGGGTGAALSIIISKYPSIKGINFDLPHVIKDAPSYPGVAHVEGDMFVSVPKGDAMFLKWVCHDWSDEHCLKLLNNCYEALPDNGKIIVFECILPVSPDQILESKIVFHNDCVMMSLFQLAKERTEDEFKALSKEAGFQGFQVVCCAPSIYIMEFLKN